MKVYRVQTTIAPGSTLYLVGLPFVGGDAVEVIVRARRPVQKGKDHPLRGMPIRYIEPFGSIDEDKWKASR